MDFLLNLSLKRRKTKKRGNDLVGDDERGWTKKIGNWRKSNIVIIIPYGAAAQKRKRVKRKRCRETRKTLTISSFITPLIRPFVTLLIDILSFIPPQIHSSAHSIAPQIHSSARHSSFLTHTLSIFRMFESSKGMDAQTMMKSTQPIDQTSYIFGLYGLPLRISGAA